MKNGVESRMDVISLCPLRVASMLWQPAPGAWTLTVVCKATYRLAPEVSLLHPEQDDPNEEDSHWDDDLRRSLSSPSDLVPFKARADVLLVGNAYSSGKQVVARLVARMIVGEVDKSIEVFGKRAWTRDGTLQEGPGFSSLPLVYERAAGGAETWNPVGVRPDAAPDAQGSVALPNLQPPGVTVARRGDVVPPIGFGPIAPAWALRAELLGRHRGALSMAAWRDRALPEDLSPAYFNAAPRDQQVEAIRGDERVVLEHLHRQHARLVTRLPGIRPRAFAERSGALPLELGMRCDTVWIDTDRGICALTWRGHVPLERPEQEGRVLVGMEERGQRVGWEEVARLAGGASGARGEVGRAEEIGERTAQLAAGTETARLSPDMVAKAALPFLEQRGGGARPSTQAAGDAGLPFVRSGGVAGESAAAKVMAPELLGVPIAPPALVRPAMVGEAGAPPLGVSPWAKAQAPGPTVGQIASSSPDARPPGTTRSGVGGGDAGSVFREPGAKIEAIGGTSTGKEVILGGALAASNAAAEGANVRTVAKSVDPALSPVARREGPREMLELIWYDPAALPRIRRHLAWKRIISELKPRPSDDDFDGGLPPEQMKAAKDKRDVFGVLARGEVQDVTGIRRAMEMAIADDGSFVPPYVLVAGAMELPFDEVETLRATVALVTPFAGDDKKLKDLLEMADRLLKPSRQAAVAAAALTAKLATAFDEKLHLVGIDNIEAHVNKWLVEQRNYQQRTVVGSQWTRALLVLQGAGAQTDVVPVYVPADASKRLPFFQRFTVRLIAEACPRTDQFETCPIALHVLSAAKTSAVVGQFSVLDLPARGQTKPG